MDVHTWGLITILFTGTTTKPATGIIHFSETLYVHEGQRAILSCGITSLIPKWALLNGEIINFNDNTFLNPAFSYQDRFSVSPEGYLVIKYTRQTNAGSYVCSYPGRGNETVGLIIRAPLPSRPVASTATPPTSIRPFVQYFSLTPPLPSRPVASTATPPTSIRPFVQYFSLTLYVHEGQNVSLTCSITDRIPTWLSPKGAIINRQDSRYVYPSFLHQNRFSVSEEGYLVINEVKQSEAGKYICSYPGYRSETVGLVIGPPLSSTSSTVPTTTAQPGPTSSTTGTTQKSGIIQISVTMYVHEGLKTILSCNINNLIPKWTHPNGGIINFNDYSFLNPAFPDQDRFSVSPRGNLVINNTQSYDAGNYVCSYPGHPSQNVGLVVLPPLATRPTDVISQTPGTKATILQISITLYIHEGQKTILSCSSVSNKIPTWTDPYGRVINAKDNSSISQSLPDRDRFSVSQDGYLYIYKTKMTDAGSYICSYPGYKDQTVGLVVTPPLSTRSTAFSSSLFTLPASTVSKSGGQTSQLTDTTNTPSSVKTPTGTLTARSEKPPSTSGSLNQISRTSFNNTQQPSSVSSKSVKTSAVTPHANKGHVATIPPLAIKCAKCSGPPEACEVAFYEDYCQPPNHYCINQITNLEDGQRLVERKCGNITTCYNDWYLGTSDDDKCRGLSASTLLTYRFECTFCCMKDSCNVDLHPKADTLYTNRVKFRY